MTTGAEAKLRNQVEALIRKEGNAVDYVSHTGGTLDPETGVVSGASDTTLADVKVTPPFQVEDRYVDGDIVQITDAVMYADAVTLGTVRPKMGDSITWTDSVSGEITSFAVLKVLPINYRGTVVAYGLVVRS